MVLRCGVEKELGSADGFRSVCDGDADNLFLCSMKEGRLSSPSGDPEMNCDMVN